MYKLGKNRISSIKWENVGFNNGKRSYYIYELGKSRILALNWEKVVFYL